MIEYLGYLSRGVVIRVGFSYVEPLKITFPTLSKSIKCKIIVKYYTKSIVYIKNIHIFIVLLTIRKMKTAAEKLEAKMLKIAMRNARRREMANENEALTKSLSVNPYIHSVGYKI